jgi:hypothetical protein
VTTIKTAWRNIRTNAKVTGRWHDHRHTLITQLAEEGAGEETIRQIQVWRSSVLRLPLLTVISDPLGGTTTSQCENVSTSTPPDSSLFTVRAGYKAVPAPQSRIIASQTN